MFGKNEKQKQAHKKMTPFPKGQTRISSPENTKTAFKSSFQTAFKKRQSFNFAVHILAAVFKYLLH